MYFNASFFDHPRRSDFASPLEILLTRALSRQNIIFISIFLQVDAEVVLVEEAVDAVAPLEAVVVAEVVAVEALAVETVRLRYVSPSFDILRHAIRKYSWFFFLTCLLLSFFPFVPYLLAF